MNIVIISKYIFENINIDIVNKRCIVYYFCFFIFYKVFQYEIDTFIIITIYINILKWSLSFNCFVYFDHD